MCVETSHISVKTECEVPFYIRPLPPLRLSRTGCYSIHELAFLFY